MGVLLYNSKYTIIEKIYFYAFPNTFNIKFLKYFTKYFFKKRELEKELRFIIGLPRSGTHTISQLFSKDIAIHEPLPLITISTLLRWLHGKTSQNVISQFIHSRQLLHARKIEASHFMHYFCKEISDHFEHAKFILTVREPKSWLYSEVNQNFIINRRSRKTIWRQLEEYRYGHYGFSPEKWDGGLIDKQLWPARAYLSYWRDHIAFVLEHVPAERLLILDVSQISESTNLIEDFFSEKILGDRDHIGGSFSKPVDITALPEEGVLDQLIEEECREVIEALKLRMHVKPPWL